MSGPGTGFSPFVPEDALRAREASRELMLAADAAGGAEAGLEAARRRVDELLQEQDRGLVRFALKLFVTHHPSGRLLRIPALERRAPLKVVPSGPPLPAPPPGAEATGVQEAVLNWWREDPEANEHHDHWHAVYPTRGLADPTPGDPGRSRLQDRQGELFFYMHQQMLARYDTERLAVGLGKVEPLERYRDPIPEGYDPTRGLRGFPPEIWTQEGAPRPRPDDARMPSEVPLDPQNTLPLRALEIWHERLADAAETGTLRDAAGGDFPAGLDDLGHAAEPSAAQGAGAGGPGVPDQRHYGNLHGFGHVFLSLAAGEPAGVMIDTDTAIRDPVFHRWHRHVDDLAFALQGHQAPHDLAANAAPVRLRPGEPTTDARPGESPDLVLIGSDNFDDDAVLGRLADWDEDFAANDPGTDELHTEMLWRRLEIEPQVPGTPRVEIPYLDQRPFAYAVRMESDVGGEHDVTVRLFIVAGEAFADRRMWIELDKFRHTMSGPRSIALRRARDCSVIRKPAAKPPGPTRHSPQDGDPRDPDTYCDCGWPYNLLLPRGTGAGMAFWLAAVVTDWSKDRVEMSTCGSMSFCGAKDRYPDARPMGYPFDRPFANGDIAAALGSLPSVAARSFRIRWLNPGFPD